MALGFPGTGQGALAVAARRQWRCGASVRGRGSQVATMRGLSGWCGRTRACMSVCSFCGLFRGSGRSAVWRLVSAGGAWLMAWSSAWVVVRGLAGMGGMGLGAGCVCPECGVDWAGAL